MNLKSVVILFLIVSTGLSACKEGSEEKKDSNLSLFDQAKNQSREVIDDISSDQFIAHFRNNPHFIDTAHVLIVQSQLRNDCKVDPTQITYYDYFKEIVKDSAEVDVIDFFYEGPSACVDFRYRVGYIIHKRTSEIELFAFKVEPVEKQSDFINLIQNRRAKEAQRKDSLTP